jgi:glycosyltransferase involved in cell wall biosynthesis
VRLLSVIHYPVFGGPHNRNIRIAPLLRQAEIDVTVLLPDEPGDAAERLRTAGVPIVTLPLHRIRGSRRLAPHVALAGTFRREVDGIRSLIREGGFEAVLINGLVNPHAGIAGSSEGVGVVWQLLDTHHPPALRRVLMPLVTSRSDVVMSTGTAVAAAHHGALALGDRLVTFFPAVDFDLFAPSVERRLAARARLGLREHDVVVGNVANLNPMKDHRNFVRAAARVHSQRPDVRFVILGAQYRHRESYVRDLIAEASSLGLEHGKSLFVHEPGSRVAELEPAFDVFWLTSRPASEGIPTAVGEAMALELPVVATDVGSVREAVADGVTGAVVPPRDPRALADATLPYIESAELRRTAGTAGRKRALELFSVEACAAAHVEAVERAAARAAVRRAARLGR